VDWTGRLLRADLGDGLLTAVVSSGIFYGVCPTYIMLLGNVMVCLMRLLLLLLYL